MDQRTQSLEKLNKALEEKFTSLREDYRSKMRTVINKLNEIDIDRDQHLKIHVEMLIVREDLVFEIASLRSKLTSIQNLYRKERKTKYLNVADRPIEIKLHTFNDKDVFISAELSDLIRQIEIFETHINFLKDQIATCDKLGFSIKHIVDSNR